MASPRRIDVHFHLIPPFYREAVYAAGRGPALGKYPDWTPQLALDDGQEGHAAQLTAGAGVWQRVCKDIREASGWASDKVPARSS